MAQMMAAKTCPARELKCVGQSVRIPARNAERQSSSRKPFYAAGASLGSRNHSVSIMSPCAMDINDSTFLVYGVD